MPAQLVAAFAQTPVLAASALAIAAALTLVTRALCDKEAWPRFLILAGPLILLAYVGAGVVVWWLIWGGGIQFILHGLGVAGRP